MTSARRHFRTPVFPLRATLFLVAATICSAQLYTISTVAGGGPPLIASAANTPFGGVGGVATDPAGNVWLTGGNCVFRLDPRGAITRVAGNSRAGNLYISENAFHRVRKVSAHGVITTVAVGQFTVSGMAADNSGNLFLADSLHYRVWKLSTTGILTPVAGTGVSGISGDGDRPPVRRYLI